jgi:ATP-binding protein involved in chromosome partitioning
MVITEEAVLAALSTVQDPDLKRNIVTLGFVKDIRIDGSNVNATIELTTPACPVKEILHQEAVDAVRAIGASEVEIEMTMCMLNIIG